MTKVSDLVHYVRSKNAGPFVLTIDLFCNNNNDYRRLCNALTTDQVAALYICQKQHIKRFELDSLNVLKFSMPRPNIQGSQQDRDMHASQWAWLLAELTLD